MTGAVKLTEPHYIEAHLWPKDTVFQANLAPAGFQYTPFMIPLDTEALAGIEVINRKIYGRYAVPVSLDKYTSQRLMWEPRPIRPIHLHGPARNR